MNFLSSQCLIHKYCICGYAFIYDEPSLGASDKINFFWYIARYVDVSLSTSVDLEIISGPAFMTHLVADSGYMLGYISIYII